jgi:hypothetical protein
MKEKEKDRRKRKKKKFFYQIKTSVSNRHLSVNKLNGRQDPGLFSIPSKNRPDDHQLFNKSEKIVI